MEKYYFDLVRFLLSRAAQINRQLVMFLFRWETHQNNHKEVTLCEVLGNPATFNHKLIKISGVVSRGFEVFTLTDGSCHNFNTIWLELGGLRGSGVIYCCGDNKIEKRREKPLVVEGIKTQLIEDEMLSRFETLTNQRHEYGKAKISCRRN